MTRRPRRNARLLYLPPYNPDLDPIEQAVHCGCLLHP
jgi:transposase